MSNSGYIRKWRRNDVGGIIHMCDGEFTSRIDNDVAFDFNNCDEALKDFLRANNVPDAGLACPPPAAAVRVRFDFTRWRGFDMATNITRV